MLWFLLILLILMLAIAVYLPLLLLAAVIVIIATIHYFVTLDWGNKNERANGLISLVGLVIIIGIVLALIQAADFLMSDSSYEPRIAIEGKYQPSCEGAPPVTCPAGCIRIEGRRAAIFGLPSAAIVTVCQPTRVSELGTLTLDSRYQSEAGWLEFANEAVYVQTELLKRHGRFEYSERSPTANDWMRHNPFTTGILVLVGLGVAVSIPLRARQ
jgi:hypothetical protein